MRTTQLIFTISLLTAGGLIIGGTPGCKKAPPPPPPAKTGAGGGSMANTGAPGGAVNSGGLTGQVVESMDAAGYTYLKIRTSKGEVWAAVRRFAVKKGQAVTVVRAQPMKDFKSRSLKRTFPLIYFGQLGKAGQAAGRRGPHAGGMMRGKGHPKRTGKRATFDKPLAKAPGADGRTVAEVYAQRATLAGKTVSVHGRVVKFSKNIMGKNWVHLQDGTGKTDDFDLTVTTQSTAKVGDLIVATGTVKSAVNIGAGYRYKVLVEKATLKPAK